MTLIDDSPPPRAAPSAGSPRGAAASADGSAQAGDQLGSALAPGTLLEVQGLELVAGGRLLARDLALRVRAGEVVAILGRSGSGKTTLLHALAGLTGDVAPSQRVAAALMPQHDGLLAWASATDNAALALRVRGERRRAARERAAAQLRALGVGNLGRRPAALLSGGERQRVALARTLLAGRELLLLDEPLASVDALTRDALHELLLPLLRSGGRGAVLVTHDLAEAARLADRLLVLAGQPATLRPIASLRGAPGDHLEARGGAELRTEVMEALGR